MSPSEGHEAPVTRPSFERAGLSALLALLLAPILAQGAWLPLEHALGSSGDAVSVTGLSLLIAALSVLATILGGGRAWLPPLVGGLVAAGGAVATSLGAAGLLALLLSAGGTAWLLHGLCARLPAELDGLARRRKGLAALYVLMAAFTLLSVARESVFIGDPTRSDLSALPSSEFLRSHSCLTAYSRAADLASQGAENLYDDHWWYGALGLPPLPIGQQNPYQPFGLDNFSYPPPFLLLMAPLAPLRGDFYAQRALWFGLNGLLFGYGLWRVARWVGGPRGHRILLLAPLLLGSVPFLATLQIGNFHLGMLVLSLLAMMAVVQGQELAGAALLAISIVSKISPGILGIVLLVQRRLRAALLSAGWGLVFVLLALLAYGLAPLRDFLTYALPRLSSGAAFPHMATTDGILTNDALFGFPFKLKFLGFDVGDPWRMASHVGHLYTLAVLVVTVLSARRGGDRREQALRWMGLLVLSAMQSPFAPGYSALGLLWATTLLASEVEGWAGALLLVGLWPATVVLPPNLPPTVHCVLAMVQTLVILGMAGWLALRRPRASA